ncbi:FAD binding domain-containing protein [Desertimonas flava]|uniref:FAD binding domain-containing protein n=1 Tax=Desertimonas flava TaxID=2064846 RepID=UPI000E340C68|nr:FAD binding domain-containing protein [Desertimonas flava]
MPVVVPRTVAEAVAALTDRPEATLLAGGTDLMVEVNETHRRVDPGETVIALNRVAELRTWTLDRAAHTLRIGAGVTYRELEAEPLAGIVPALGQAARTVGSPQIRNAATIGGNVATCSPAGDGLPVLAAVEADVELTGLEGVRSLPITDFMVGVKRTALAPGELITAITVPLLDGWQGYAKVGVRNAMVISIAGACLAVHRPARSVRVALGSVGPTILRASDAERFAADAVDWESGTVDVAVVEEFGRRAAAAARPIDDHRSSAVYRRHAVEVLAKRLLVRAFPATAEVAA